MKATILFGSDTGDAQRIFAAARRATERVAGRITAVSRVLTSRAWGFESQKLFSNQAVEVETELAPEALLDAMQQVELLCGRDREAEAHEKRRTGQRYASRVLDADIIFCEGIVVDTPRLKVPHPLVAERAFALRPIAEIAPALRHPQTGRTVTEMLAALDGHDGHDGQDGRDGHCAEGDDRSF